MEIKRLIADIIRYADNGDMDRFRLAVYKLACFFYRAGERDFAEDLELLVSRGDTPQTAPPPFVQEPFIQEPSATPGLKDGTRLTYTDTTTENKRYV